MESSESFIELINSLCRRSNMFVLNGSYKEVVAFIYGYTWKKETPISSRKFDRFVCLKHGFPTNYVWSYVIDAFSANDQEAIESLKNTILEFIELSARMNDEQLEQFAASMAQELFKKEGEAERIFRLFDSALLAGNREAIEPIIKWNPNADVLWSGEYPSGVMSLLNEISSSQPIRKVSDSDDGKTIKLLTSGWPFPIEMINSHGNWIVNADPIIQLRIDNISNMRKKE